MPKKMAVKAIMMSQPGPFSSEDASGPPLVPREHTKRPKTAKMPCEKKYEKNINGQIVLCFKVKATLKALTQCLKITKIV